MYKGLYIQRYIRRKERARTFKGEILFFLFFFFTLPQTQYNSCYGRWAGSLGSERSRLYTLSASLSAMNPWPIHHIRSKGHYICEHSPMIINIFEELQQHLSILSDKSMTQVFCSKHRCFTWRSGGQSGNAGAKVFFSIIILHLKVFLLRNSFPSIRVSELEQRMRDQSSLLPYPMQDLKDQLDQLKQSLGIFFFKDPWCISTYVAIDRAQQESY